MAQCPFQCLALDGHLQNTNGLPKGCCEVLLFHIQCFPEAVLSLTVSHFISLLLSSFFSVTACLLHLYDNFGIADKCFQVLTLSPSLPTFLRGIYMLVEGGDWGRSWLFARGYCTGKHFENIWMFALHCKDPKD